MKPFFIVPFLLLQASCFTNINQDNRLGYNNSPIHSSEVTTDISFIGETEGQGNRYELFGIFKWGDSGLADYEGQYADSFIGGESLLKTKQAAVYNAIEGRKDSFLIDPQFRTTEKDYIFFKSVKSEVIGQHAKKSNYRQIKRFTTDSSDTMRLPYTYSVKRNGVEVTSITASRDIPPHVTDTINLVESKSGSTLNINKGTVGSNVKTRPGHTYSPYDPVSNNQYQSLEARMRNHTKRIGELKQQYQVNYR